MRPVFADHLEHDGCRAGQRLDVDLNRAACFQPGHQTVVVNNARDVGIIDVGGQFGGVVGIDDHNLGVGLKLGQDFRLIEVPFIEHEQRFGIRLAQQNGFGSDAFDLIEIPSPNDRAAGAVGVGGFMAKNKRCHGAVLSVRVDLRAL